MYTVSKGPSKIVAKTRRGTFTAGRGCCLRVPGIPAKVSQFHNVCLVFQDFRRTTRSSRRSRRWGRSRANQEAPRSTSKWGSGLRLFLFRNHLCDSVDGAGLAAESKLWATLAVRCSAPLATLPAIGRRVSAEVKVKSRVCSAKNSSVAV